MKLIDLLTKIANGEIDENAIFEFDNGYNDYCSVRVFFDRFIMDKENLNLEIKLKEDNNKIEKIDHLYILQTSEFTDTDVLQDINNKNIRDKINEIIDKINNME